MSNRTRILVASVLVLSAVLWMILHYELQQFFFRDLWSSLSHADPRYLLLAGGFTFASYFFRCFRWRTFVRPMKKTSLWNLVAATVLGFSAIALLSRAGEVVRPWLISQKEQLSLSSQFGTWTLERAFDTLALVIVLGIALWSIPPPVEKESSVLLGEFRSAGIALVVVALGLAALLAQLRYLPRFSSLLFGWFARPLPEQYRSALRRTVQQFSVTLGVLENRRTFLACIIWTVLVWLMLVGGYWSTAQAFGEPLSLLPLGAVMLVMVAAGMGSLLHLPGVGGGTQVASILTLTGIFQIPLPAATAMSLAVWIIMYMLVLVPGIPLAALEGLSWRGIRGILGSRGTEGSGDSSAPPAQ
jgi:uncharacterized protein (TIRG00374 family)